MSVFFGRAVCTYETWWIRTKGSTAEYKLRSFAAITKGGKGRFQYNVV